MNQPDMTRPVPAAPSPGSSARRARLSEADRQRISQVMAIRFKDKPLKCDRVGVQHRFTRGDLELACLKDGSIWCFRAGKIERGAIVSPLYGRYRSRVGVVTGIVPIAGDQVAIAVWFKSEKRAHYDHEAGKVREYRCRPPAFWRRDELEVIGHIDKQTG